MICFISGTFSKKHHANEETKEQSSLAAAVESKHNQIYCSGSLHFFREITLLLALVKCAVGSLKNFVTASVVIYLLQLSQGHIFRQEVRLEFDLSRRV